MRSFVVKHLKECQLPILADIKYSTLGTLFYETMVLA